MLLLLGCSCSGVDGLLRGALRDAGITDWLDPPIVKGKKKSLETLTQFPEYYRNLPQWGALYDSINTRSSFAVVIGYDAEQFRWADVAMGDLKSKLDAEVIASHFVNKT